ncbi:MAG: class I SAM-dependent methyltransferase [Oligoflexia bacterium]|nr:class I SAM-dependent methyltransferase [Oligoflexia bacterium]MBF0364831.1 class I SAM-dependent methyltransferase [Oligoflexia bacterium]
MQKELYLKLYTSEENHWWFWGRRNIVRTLITTTFAQSTRERPLEILEIGSGTGGNLKMLDEFGCVSAIEPDPDALKFSKEKSQQLKNFKSIHSGSLPHQLALTQERFDLILLCDVLEHVQEDAAALMAIRALLRPQGVLIVTVPALNFLWSEYDRIHGHCRRYTKRELKQKLESAPLQFTLLKLAYFNFFMLLPLIAMRFCDKLLHVQFSVNALNVPVAPLNSLFKIFMRIEALLLLKLSSLPLGSSLVAVVAFRPSDYGKQSGSDLVAQ